MNTNNKQEFREKFCKVAADLGVCPSELASLVESLNTKQADLGEMLGKLKDIGLGTTAAAALVGAGFGGLSAYVYNDFRKDIDPDDSYPILNLNSDVFSSAEEAKKLHLMAKYRNAIRDLKYSLKNPPSE